MLQSLLLFCFFIAGDDTNERCSDVAHGQLKDVFRVDLIRSNDGGFCGGFQAVGCASERECRINEGRSLRSKRHSALWLSFSEPSKTANRYCTSGAKRTLGQSSVRFLLQAMYPCYCTPEYNFIEMCGLVKPRTKGSLR